MMDLPDLIIFFGKALTEVNAITTSKGSGDSERSSQMHNLLALMVETLTLIANQLLNADPQQTELYFLEYGCHDLVDVMTKNVFKLNDMAVLLYCFVQDTNNSHHRVLTKVSEHL